MHVLHIICLQQEAYQIGGAHFSSGNPQKFAKQTEYNSKTTFYKQKHSI